MEPMGLVIIVLVARVVVAGVWLGGLRRRCAHLRERFGPEYERAVSRADSTAEGGGGARGSGAPSQQGRYLGRSSDGRGELPGCPLGVSSQRPRSNGDRGSSPAFVHYRALFRELLEIRDEEPGEHREEPTA
ncbi:MAG TPA: hypothetical protein VGR49_03960 [Actinomycetota bacterium]|nr:hypothetical protein [Actinomycetota bacterium]